MTDFDLVQMVERGLGAKRLANLKKDDDNYQNFWVGVLKSLPRSDKYADKVPYLIRSGYGEISDAYRKEARVEIRKWCPKCGKYRKVSSMYCRECGTELETADRTTSTDLDNAPDIADPHRYGGDPDVRLDVDGFIRYLTQMSVSGEISGKIYHVAWEWLVNRIDLRVDNHLKELGAQLNMTAQGVARIKKQVRALFAEWYDGIATDVA